MNNSIQQDIQIYSLTCNYLDNPLGVETMSPRLSWKLFSEGTGQWQTSYRILVSTSLEKLHKGEGDLWDTDKVESDQSINIVYRGKALSSRQTCYWKVCVWDRNGLQSVWSETSYWEMGILYEKEWQGKWITSREVVVGLEESENGYPAPMFRKTCRIDKKITEARAYICGLGYYDFHINGRKVGDTVLDPAFTRYDQTVLYQTYDITEYLNAGENVFGAILGNGWYNCFTEVVWNFKQAPWRDNCKMLLQVYIKTDDGEEQVIVSDKSWHSTTGPITFNGLRNGEFYNAKLEKKGWSKPGYEDGDWENAIIARAPGGLLRSQQMPNIRVTKTLLPVSLIQVREGVWVYDFGQNISGWAKISVRGIEGTEITLKYAERVKPDGDIEQESNNQFVTSGEFQTDKYILKGDGEETWEPRFTYHGFRYIQVTGFPGKPDLNNVCGQVVHTDFKNRGGFECSNELLNRIQENARWTTLTNYHGVPTDCPHREKNGWAADAHLAAEQVFFNFDPVTAYAKWIRDFKDVQRPSGQLPGIVPTGGWGYNWGSGPAWDSAFILIPWYMYVYCGDTAILDESYDAMKKYVDYMTSMAVDSIVEFGLGDWLPPQGEKHIKKSKVSLTDTAYYYVDTLILSKVAAILGKSEDSYHYSNQAEEIRKAVKEKLIDVDHGIAGDNGQTSLACVLYQGIIESDEAGKIMDALTAEIERCDFHIDCGILGTKYLLHALTQYGRADLAYIIATQKTHPSWGYMIEQGATTMWEDWEGSESLNHPALSSISSWFYKDLAGINPDPDSPGFKHIMIKPNLITDLKWTKAWHESMYGQIRCEWAYEDGLFQLNVEIPVNCNATVYLPGEIVEEVKNEDLQKSKVVSHNEKPSTIVNIGSGRYSFKVRERLG